MTTHTSAETVAHAIAYAMIDAKMLVDPDAHAAVEALIQRHVEPLIERERVIVRAECERAELARQREILDGLGKIKTLLAAHPRQEDGAI